MPPLTVLMHTANDALRLGRALEMLVPCDEIVIIDHASGDATRRVARDYGALVVDALADAPPSFYLASIRRGWILCLRPSESISERLQATLYEWKTEPADRVAPTPAFSLFVREETPRGWRDLPAPETRLVPRHWQSWHGFLPVHDPSAVALEGELLRFALP